MEKEKSLALDNKFKIKILLISLFTIFFMFSYKDIQSEKKYNLIGTEIFYAEDYKLIGSDPYQSYLIIYSSLSGTILEINVDTEEEALIKVQEKSEIFQYHYIHKFTGEEITLTDSETFEDVQNNSNFFHTLFYSFLAVLVVIIICCVVSSLFSIDNLDAIPVMP